MTSPDRIADPAHIQGPQLAERVDESGPGPFVTLRRGSVNGRRFVWSSRAHRKGFLTHEAELWLATRGRRLHWPALLLNRWIGVGFGIGSLLFFAGSVLSLAPDLARDLQLSTLEVNAVYFVGSIAFTVAAYLQLFQSANADIATAGPRPRPELIGWHPREIGWLSSFLQFLGTLLFNASTFAALGGGGWLRQDLTIWGPDVLGSVLFLASGYLAFIETCHAFWGWQPRSLSWWVVYTNLLGCIAFMVSAVFAFVPASTPNPVAVELATLFTAMGAVGFLAGSLLMLREGSAADDAA
jgi:hypothetical protein